MNPSDMIRHLEAHDLPEGWSETTVGQVAEDISYGFTAKASSSETGPRYLRITDLQNGTVDWESVPSCRIPKEKIQKYVLRRGDLVFARTGATTGKSFLVRSCPEAVFASYLIRVRPSLCVLPEFLALFFQTASYWNQISENISGSAQPNCNATKLASLTLPVPPLDEQRRIVSKVEEVLDNLDACQKRLAKIPVILKRFRQSVLAAACSGRLTAEWREEEEDPGPTKEPMFEPDGARGIPSNWVWKRLSDLTQIKGGVTKGRKFQGRKTILLPYLRVANVQDGYLGLHEIKQIEVLPGDRQKYSLKPGDVLFTEGGDRDKLGRGTIWRGEIANCIHQNHIFRARLTTTAATAEYLSLASKSEFSRQYFFANASQTVNLASINLTMLSGLPIPLPPLKEQIEIITRVNSLFSFVDQIEARYRNAQAQVNRLTQSILAKAFGGELVPTDAELARR